MVRKPPDAVDLHVGNLIRSLRLAEGMSQTALGDELGVSFQQVQKYERGVNRVSPSRLAKIADLLGVEPSFFFPSNGKSKTKTPEALTLITTMGATNLLRAYSEIKNVNARRAVVALAEALRDLKA
jgi:transcriptional regulator with XRE-family HTH domain